jgi:DNA-binding NarL/FixJ family response regulator
MIARTAKPLSFRPRLVLAYADSAHAALSGRHFRRLGWEVHLASTGPEARRLAQALAPSIVVLDTDLREESGWLTCAKLIQERPGQRVVLLGSDLSPEAHEFAAFVGAAALVSRDAGPNALVESVQGTVLTPAATGTDG